MSEFEKKLQGYMNAEGYMSLWDDFEKLSAKERARLFPELLRAFTEYKRVHNMIP